MNTVRVFARLKSKTGNEDSIREGLMQLVSATRQESGVLKYELYETVDGGEFILDEEYGDQLAFEVHIASDHLKNAVALLTPMMLGGLKLWQTRQIA